jgi:N-[(2S)-2-amino-2-carboxyethyl]-L-glutamate dehydrogenase
MLYLNQSDIENIGIDWVSITKVIESTVRRLGENDFAQPIKPYLRYQDLKNRIIAMPAYVGGSQAGQRAQAPAKGPLRDHTE